ncbi:hypothetical protein [Catellatospora sp. NPDC049133]|uniref:hypothetical protein n=1 Tax=Catellatospora sp. NPDC049133 TaxID=3155499 RepID=UPI0034045F8C
MNTAPEHPPTGPADGIFVRDVMRRIEAAERAGDRREVDRLMRWANTEGSDRIGSVVAQLVEARQQAAFRATFGLPQVAAGITLAEPGQQLCDFCGVPGPSVYYPFQEFVVVSGPGGTVMSGDRMYACSMCASYVDADDWPGMAGWLGAAFFKRNNKRLFRPFRRNRTGDPVPVAPGSDPERGRTHGGGR